MKACSPPSLLDQRLARAQRQVVGVRQHDLGARRAHLVRRQRLERAVRAHGHEGGRREAPVRSREAAGAGQPAAGVRANLKDSRGIRGAGAGRSPR